MKFGKYLATRQLELPEYAGQFIDYKALKKLINRLALDASIPLQDKRGSFFFRVERELEKVNSFYLEKESELKFRLDILLQKKAHLLKKARLNKSNIEFISLYDGFKKFSKDLERLEQFVELNETGFIKVLKKWDKRSKSTTKELYLTTTVNVQPVFHRNEIIVLSDQVANNLLELEAIGDGDNSFIRYDSVTSNTIETTNKKKFEFEFDQLYTDFYEITLQNANLGEDEQVTKLKEWSNQVISMLPPDTKKLTLSKVFMLLIGNTLITDSSLLMFYNVFIELIDLQFVDDLNKRTCLIQVCSVQAGRNEILKILLDSNLDPSVRDVTGRSCLHYVTENGRHDFLISILDYIKQSDYNLNEIIDLQTYESLSPLLLAIINNKINCVEALLSYGSNAFPLQDETKPNYLPFNVACKMGNLTIVQLLLNQIGSTEDAKNVNLLTRKSQCNAEGMLPLHIVASSGNHHLIQLLLDYGADINQLDKLNKWSCIFYAIFAGDVKMTEILIKFGSNINLKDEDNFDPLYYSIWEGNIGVLNVLKRALENQKKSEKDASLVPSTLVQSSTSVSSSTQLQPTPVSSIALGPNSGLGNSGSDEIDLDMDLIPELSLPPPIIPLRKYGHNFLEKRISLKLSFYTNRNSIQLNPNTFLTSIPGRITLTCTNNDLIPRNITLPVLDNSKSVTFQVESIDDSNFNISFELFPTFGTRLLCKTSLNSSNLKQSIPGLGSKSNGDIELPLLDVRLKTIGTIKFNYEIIHPYSGIPLEISMYDTYWKSSPTSDEQLQQVKSISFVTSSSLNGEYYKTKVSILHDGTPLVCPQFNVDIGHNIPLPICLFKYDQLKSIVYKNEAQYESMLDSVRQLNTGNSRDSFSKVMQNVYLPLNDFLNLINYDINLNLDLFFPTNYEFEKFDFNSYTCFNLNDFIDSFLTDIFNHVRQLRLINNNQHSRSLLLSSNNANVCTILNWKQPNYPVFYNLNGIQISKDDNQFYETSANGLPKPLKDEPVQNPIEVMDNTTVVDMNILNSIDNFDSVNKDSSEYINSIEYEDKMTRSIKLSVTYAINNNLLGISIPKQLLNLSPQIIQMIRSNGLILLASIDDFNRVEPLSKKDDEDVDIDVLKIDNGVKEDLGVHGVRINDILWFENSIDM